MNVRCSNGDAPHRIAGSMKFVGSNLRGMVWDDCDSPRSMGRLPRDEERSLWDALESHGMRNVYVVWSYVTPIGWRLPDGEWHRVGQKFSVTTSRHQNMLNAGMTLASKINL